MRDKPFGRRHLAKSEPEGAAGPARAKWNRARRDNIAYVEGRGAGPADVLSPEEVDAEAAVEKAAAGGEARARRGLDLAVLEADRRWRAEFVQRASAAPPGPWAASASGACSWSCRCPGRG